jgi:hypothetical protein
MKKIQILVLLLATASFGKSMLSSISIGKGTGIEYRRRSLDSKVILNGDALYRLNDWAHTGLEIDLNTWDWSRTIMDVTTFDDTTKATLGRAGFLGAFRAEIPKGEVKFFGQVGLGLFSNNLNLSGGGINGAPKNPPLEWGGGYNIQAGLVYKIATIKLSNKNIFISDAEQNWFGISAGLCWEYF